MKTKVIWHLPFAMIGGTETLYAVILKYLDPNKFENYVTCHESIAGWCDLKFKGKAKIRSFIGPHDLEETISITDPDVIIGTHGGTLYSALASCSKEYPVIEVVHGSHIWGEHNVWMPKKWTKHIICVSKSAERVYLANSNFNIPTSVIINGVDTEVFRPFRPVQQQAKVVGYIGRFMESDKHLTKILSAFKSVRDSNARLYLAGGNEKDITRLRLHARSLKIENLVKFFEHTDSPQKYYEQIDVFTVRSEAEGYCNSAAEALACGIPLVAYNFGGILEHVPHGTIAVANSQSEYAKLLRDVFMDPQRRKKMRDQGLEFISREGNAHIMAKKYEETILSVLSGVPVKKEEPVKPRPTVLSAPGIRTVTVQNTRPVVGVCNYSWHGIATATKNICDKTVNWRQDAGMVVHNVLNNNPRAVLFSGMCPGFKDMMRLLKKKSPDTPIYGYYHGGPSHYSFQRGLFGHAEAEAFQSMLDLHGEGIIKKIAVSSPGYADVLRANGIDAEFCGNIVGHIEKPDLPLLPGVNIGNWNRHHDHKHTSIGIAAAQLYPDAKVHCLQGYPRMPGVNYGRVISYPEMSQELLYQKYAQMTVNLQMSFIETFNISVMEMWACGRPVVLGPGNLILVEKSPLEGYVVCWDHTNPVALKKTIDYCMKNADEIIDLQYAMLRTLNQQSRLRWDKFFL